MDSSCQVFPEGGLPNYPEPGEDGAPGPAPAEFGEDTFTDEEFSTEVRRPLPCLMLAANPNRNPAGAADPRPVSHQELPQSSTGVSFANVSAWRRVGEWAMEQEGVEEVVVAQPKVSHGSQ